MIKPEKIVLPNGMTLLLIESHQSPVVAFNACFRVGSVVEQSKEAGICHFIEHMIFKGTPSRPAGEIARTIEAAGGEINAYTSFDETVYYCTVSSRFFDEGLNVLSDAVLNPLFEDEEIAREKPVILEEINHSADNPSKILSENLFRCAFKAHPYGKPIIGTKESVLSFTRADILDFYHRWYVPRNLVFVIAGDFDSAQAKQKVFKIFENYEDRTLPALSFPLEPPQHKARFTVIRKPVSGQYAQLAFPIPAITSPDVPALDILSHLLGEGLSSRLEQRIKEKKGLVDSIYSYAYTPFHPGLFVIGFTTAEKKIIPAATAILKEILLIENDRISHAELARSRVNIKSDAWYERESVEGLARKYGYLETILGDCNFDQKYYQKIDEIDPEDVHEVARKYLIPQALNWVVLLPEKSKLTQAQLAPEKLLKASELRLPKKKLTEKKDIQITRLKNGITLIYKENQRLPLVSIKMANFGGVRFENPKNNGIHHLLAQTLTKGTKSRSHEQLALEIEQIAASISAYSGRNLDGLQADFLSEKLEAGLNLFSDILLNPAFEPNQIEKEKKHTLEALRREQDQLASIAYKKLLSELYPHHPYGLPIVGVEKSVQSLTRADLLKAHRQFLNPETLVFSVVGDCDPNEIKDCFSKHLEDLKPFKGSAALKLKEPTLPKSPIKAVLKQSKAQSHIVVGFLGTTLNGKDRYAMDVMNNILAGQGGRLFLELRDKQSLAYSVTSFSQEGIERGFFSVYIATEPQKTEKAIDGIFTQLKKIKSELASDAEIDRAKRYLMGSFEIDLQRNSNVAGQLALSEIYGLGADHWRKFPGRIEMVTREQVREAANRYLNLDAYVMAIVGG